MEPIHREIELKLELAPRHFSRLSRHPRLRALTVGRASTRQLHSVYFDSADLDLAHHGVGLRIRRAGRQRVQTVKTEGVANGVLFDRGEYEAPLVGERPDLSLIQDAALRERLQGLLRGKPLVPIFETDMRRTRRVLSDGISEWTLDLDRGQVRSEGASAPISEVELELRHGDPACLFDLALVLQETLPLTLGTESKAARGYALITGARPLPRRAAPVPLSRGRPLEDALAAIVRSCLDQITANAVPAAEGLDPEGVHQMRIGVRRLRSALACFKRLVPPEQTRPLRGELRWLSSVLGAARDLDVFSDEILAPILRHEAQDPALKRLRDEAVAMRGERQEAVAAAIGSPRYTRLVLLVGRWLTRADWRDQPLSESAARLFQPAEDFAGPVLSRLHRKTLRLGREIDAAPIAARHELRLQLKKLRYASEFFREMYPRKSARRYVRAVQRLQDLLGHLNDAATAERLLDLLIERLGEEARPEHDRAAGFVQGWASCRAAEDDRRLARRWNAFEHTPVFFRR